MDANAMKLLLDTAAKSHSPRFFTPPAGTEEKNVYYVAHHDGRIEKKIGDLNENHLALDIASVIRFAAACKGCDIYYSRAAIVAHHIESGGRITKKLDCSRQFQQLIDWDEKTVRLDQISLFRLLRTTFRDCMGQHYDSTLQIIKNVDIKKKNDATTSVSRAGVSVSKSIMADVSGIDKLPEHFTFAVPVFSDTDLHAYQNIRVSVDIDPQTDSFLLTVLPGDIEKAWRYGELYLAREIEKEIAAQFPTTEEGAEAGEPAPHVYYGELHFGEYFDKE